MSFGFGVGDFLTAAQLAWTVYSACQAAPSQFKALSDEVEALHIVLESIKKVVLGAGLDASNVNDLNRVSRGCITVLTELEALIKKYKSLGTNRRKRDRLRWGQEDIDVLRARLTSNVSLLTAFNSSLMNASQTTIITRLDQVLTDIQEGRMGTSSIAELNAELESQGNQVTRKRISQELGRHALLQHAVNKNRAFIIPKINQAINGKEWQIEVVSATYGSLDVTDRVWQFLREDYSTPQIFLPSNAFFGLDPMPMRVKAFILVCRMTPPPSNGIEHPDSFFQTKRFLEGQPVTFDYDITLPRFIAPATSPHNIIILDASYHTWDVTKIVAEIAATQKEWPLIIQANNAQFGKNTAPGIGKQLSITYAYRSPDGDGVLDHHVEVVDEDDTITIPLQPSTIHVELTIHAAYWADWDVTQLLRSRVSQNQTLLIDTSAIHSFDPWFNVLKTLSIMYQYTNGPLQLTVCDDRSGVIFIGPTRSLQRNFFNPADPQEDKLNVLAVVWGGMWSHPEPLDVSQFEWIAERRRFPCTNEWFGFDGRLNWHKTCHVFYQFGTSGAIRCMAVREGQECHLSEMPW